MEWTDGEAIREREHRTWESQADSYAEITGWATTGTGQIELIDRAIGLSSSDAVVDVGCGPGQLTSQLALRVDRVVGCDFSARMVAAARLRYPNIDFHEADAEDLPFDAFTFDVVIGNYLCNHLADPQAAFREFARVLRPDGRVVLVTPIASRQIALAVLQSGLVDVMGEPDAPMYTSGPLADIDDPAVYATLLESSGFDHVESSSVIKPLRVEGIDRLLATLWALAGLAHAPDAVQDDIRSAVADRCAPYATDAGYEFPDEVLIATGTRA